MQPKPLSLKQELAVGSAHQLLSAGLTPPLLGAKIDRILYLGTNSKDAAHTKFSALELFPAVLYWTNKYEREAVSSTKRPSGGGWNQHLSLASSHSDY